MTLEIATAEHTHAHEDVCTSACPASPWFEPVPPADDEGIDPVLMEVTKLKLQVAFLSGKIDALTDQQTNIATMLATVVETVGPTLDKLTDHPMLKMFLGGK